MVEFVTKTDSLFCALNNKTLEIERWCPDGIRVPAMRLSEIKQDWIGTILPMKGHR